MERIPLKDNEISKIIQSIEAKELKPSSHLYKRFPGLLIGKASETFETEYCNEAKDKPGIVLLSVILAAHRNYTRQVEPQIDRIRKANFKSFNDLRQKTESFDSFALFTGMRDMEKYLIISRLLDAIDILKRKNKIAEDYKVLNDWAVKADYRTYMTDIIGSIKGIGIATFQHLRMNFGANTVKPDQRVKEVLNKEFGFYSGNDIDYIFAVEDIARILGKGALYVDQIFVNYGSGYYTNDLTVQDQKTLGLSEIEQKNEPKKNEINEEKHTNDLVQYLENAVKDLDVTVQKRGDEGYIAVANKLSHLPSNKNVFTYWPTQSSVGVIILGYLQPRKTYYSVEALEKDQVASKIKSKYIHMGG